MSVYANQNTNMSQSKIQLPPYLEFADADDEHNKCIEFRDRVITF